MTWWPCMMVKVSKIRLLVDFVGLKSHSLWSLHSIPCICFLNPTQQMKNEASMQHTLQVSHLQQLPDFLNTN